MTTINKSGQLKVTINEGVTGDRNITLSCCDKERFRAFALRDGASIVATIDGGMFHKVITVTDVAGNAYDYLTIWDEKGVFFSRIALCGESESQVNADIAAATRNFREYIPTPSVPVMSSTDLDTKRLNLRYWGEVPVIVPIKMSGKKVVRHAYYNLAGRVAITAVAGGEKNMYNQYPNGATGMTETSPLLRLRELRAIELRSQARLVASMVAKDRVVLALEKRIEDMLQAQSDKMQIAAK
jgi:hypothetical protein|tara:strand:- start:8 stop:730 length:723 start_codon:yes stop_codon:yes gene_type:complete